MQISSFEKALYIWFCGKRKKNISSISTAQKGIEHFCYHPDYPNPMGFVNNKLSLNTCLTAK